MSYHKITTLFLASKLTIKRTSQILPRVHKSPHKFMLTSYMKYFAKFLTILLHNTSFFHFYFAELVLHARLSPTCTPVSQSTRRSRESTALASINSYLLVYKLMSPFFTLVRLLDIYIHATS